MSISHRLILFSFIIFLFTFDSNAQTDTGSGLTKSNIKEITISYALELKSNKSNTGIGETYNGGTKTIFISGDKVRVRLVSLMRMQSIFILPPGNAKHAVLVKESGKNKYKSYFSGGEWSQYNKKYDSATCILTTDSAVILDYPCRKAIIELKDGRTINAYYTDSIQNTMFQSAEPAFQCIPGTMLKYEINHRKGTVTLTATSISSATIATDIFKIPVKGFTTKKVSFTKSANGEEGAFIDPEETSEEQ